VVRPRHRDNEGILELTIGFADVEHMSWLAGDVLPPSDIVFMLVERIGAELVLHGSESPAVSVIVPTKSLLTEERAP
jgi:hypothetical protein